MKPYSTISLNWEEEGQIARLVFNRPDSMNAMNRVMMSEIIDAMARIDKEPDVRVAVLSGAGGNFMAGADIKEYARQTSEQFFSFQRLGQSLYRAIEESGIPFVAMIQGYALGGGLEIALACDFIYAGAGASMGLPEVHLALVPGGGGTQRLAEKTGVNRAKEMLFTGDRYSARQLEQWGIVNKVVDDGELESATLGFCQKILRRSKRAVAEAKSLVSASFRPAELLNRIRYESSMCHSLFLENEAQEKIRKFTEKS